MTVGALWFVNRVTLRDLGAVMMAMASVGGIIILAVLGDPIPQELSLIAALSGGYFLRGVENGGLAPKIGGNGR
jgi:hypothetical protein